MADIMIAKITSKDEISPDEEAALRSLITRTRNVAADDVFIPESVELSESTVLLEGIACRFKDLANGERQISALHVPGDFVDLHSFPLKHLDHSIMALSACVIAPVPHADIERVTETLPHLTRLFWFSTTVDAAIHREWTVSLGRRTAIERVAHLFCELHARLKAVGLADDDGFDLPISQQELSECLGLTPVHVNRTLKALRERELAVFRGSRVTIVDYPALAQAAEFDPGYLYLEKRPR